MTSSPGRVHILLLLSLLGACGVVRNGRRAGRSGATTQAAQPPPVLPGQGLYAADEALRDVLAEPLSYVGTGKWPGIRRMYACAFRNQRVLVVNVYCGITERQAFRLDVYSPTRGRVRLYAETKGQVSARTRADYFTFMAESEPPPGPEASMPPLLLSMTFQDLRVYEERRYSAFLPACYGGQELSRPKAGCLGALASADRGWAEQNRTFLERASDDWYRVVREMRAQAGRFGKEPD